MEIVNLLVPSGESATEREMAIAKRIVEMKENVVNILTMTPASHPKARKANGATRKPRKPKTEQPANPQ